MNDLLITMDTGEQYLAHYGVKGMKWGIRKADSDDVSGGGSSDPNKMTDEELDEILRTYGVDPDSIPGTGNVGRMNKMDALFDAQDASEEAYKKKQQVVDTEMERRSINTRERRKKLSSMQHGYLMGAGTLGAVVPGGAYLGSHLANRIIGGKEKYRNQVDANSFNRRAPGEKSHEYQVKQERKASKQEAKNAVDSKVSSAKDKWVNCIDDIQCYKNR